MARVAVRLAGDHGRAFGLSTGLLIEENRLLARAILVLDKQGVLRYLEIVPELSKLPQMKKAFEFARSL